MAFKKTLVQRLFNLSRFSTPSISRTSACTPKPPSEPPEPTTTRIKRNMQRRPFYQSSAAASTAGLRLFPPTNDNLLEKLKEMNIAKDRIRLSGLIALPQPPTTVAREEEDTADVGLSVSEVKKVLRASQVELIREKLSELKKDWVEYNEYMKLIEQSCGGNKEQALMFAKTLDDSGSVIVLGNSVCLRPHQVAKAIQSLVTPTVADPNDPRKQELEMMEEQKAEIDQKAEALVRRELWAGLGYMVVQTAAFMRLTFWELSWDVMEPICFYVTSAYFMLGYTFFLRTAKEPSFEGFFQSRFSAKQKRLMKTQNFDIERYNELRKAFYPQEDVSSSLDHSRMIKFDHHKIN